MKRRLLVLTSATGSGHDMRARAFAEWVREVHGESVETRIEQVIENGSLLGRFGVWLYNTIHRQAPILHNLYFFIVEAFILTHSRRVSFGGRHYRRLLRDDKPDVILSVHDSTNRGYFEDARRILGPSVRCGTYCGEFSGGYGYSRNWVNPRADFFIARTANARDHAVSLGMDPAKTTVFHKLLSPDLFLPAWSPAERERYLGQLGFSTDRFTVFLATGGYGANHHRPFLKALLPLAGQLQVIVVCGRNKGVYRRIGNWAGRHPQLRLHLEGYSHRMADYLRMADAVITRGGANTTMEALHFGCPLLYDAVGGLMPQEHCTVRYFLDKGAARLVRRPGHLRTILEQWTRAGGEYGAIRSNLLDLQFDEDPRDLVRVVLGDD